MWPSTYSFGYNSMDVGPKRDIVGELERAFRLNHPDIHFGLYYCLWEFENPIWLKDLANKKTTRYAIRQLQNTTRVGLFDIIYIHTYMYKYTAFYDSIGNTQLPKPSRSFTNWLKNTSLTLCGQTQAMLWETVNMLDPKNFWHGSIMIVQ